MPLKRNLFSKGKKITKKTLSKYRNQRIAIGRSLMVRGVPKIHFHKVTTFLTDNLSYETEGGNPSTGSYVYGWDTANNTPQPFMLSQLPNVLEFQALYDAYKILKVVIQIIPSYNVVQNADSNNLALIPGIHSVLDFNGQVPVSASPTLFTTNLNQLVQYSTYRYTRGGRIHKRVITPRMAENVQSTTSGGVLTTVTGIEASKRWIDTQQADVRHYGIILMSDRSGVPDVSSLKFTTKATYYLVFKNTR